LILHDSSFVLAADSSIARPHQRFSSLLNGVGAVGHGALRVVDFDASESLPV